ncbi:MAG TPA: M48 family metallopeptidase [Candidatus Koribacter sp.]|jgi:STE24 endopeptidase
MMATLPVPQTDSPEARKYNRIKRWLGFSDLIVGFAFLLVLVLTHGSTRLRDFAYLGARQYYSIAVFLYVLMLMIISKLLTSPLEFYSFRLEHKFNLSNQKLGAWLLDELKGFALGLVLLAILTEVLYATIRAYPDHWWLIMWAIFMGFTLLLAQLAPVVLLPIFYHFEPLKNDTLSERLTKLSERAGTRIRGVYEWKISEKSKKANAALTGLGKTRRIIVADTLLNNYSDDEIEAVLAHELGHHVHAHIPKSILLQIGITFVGFWAADRVLRYAVEQRSLFQGLADFANLPLLALIAAVLGLLLTPLLNAYSRHNERQADEYAWKSIPSIGPFVTGMHKLASQNLAEEHPPGWIETLFHSHPSIGKRTAAAEAWRLKQPQN